MNKRLMILGSAILILASCNCKQTVSDKYEIEPHSHAKPNQAVITHLDLDINVDFEKEIIKGKATYKIENNDSKQIILDSKYLDIEKVEADGVATDFTLSTPDEVLGSALVINIMKNTKTISVYYNTTDKTEALQWLKPEQTADKTSPFLFTQGQDILTRTLIPIQDSPQIRVTYNATVKVPNNLMAVMSAENPKEKSADGVYNFSMKQKISPYLIAIAIGDIEYKAVSERTGVYAEKSMIEKAHYEFADMEKMVLAAEGLYGKYDWDQFDVIVLPPSFPFGGMENPRLTFATPTVIAGDRSLTSLIAHELAHSWSGNLVTNSTWDDFWMNEGFTVYLETRIKEYLYGKDRANMLALIGRQDLAEQVESFKNNPEDTKLKLSLEGRNPDDGMNSIAYDKGYLFLRTLEETVGREKFDVFLKSYFKKHAFSTITTEKFIKYLNKNLLEPNKIDFNTEEWVYKPGVPSNASVIKSDKFKDVSSYIAEFSKTSVVNTEIVKDWTTQEWVYFVRNFPKNFTKEQMSTLDKSYDLTNSGNSYIAMVWYEQSINFDYRGNDVDAKIKEFLTRVGRRWYVSTLFKAYKTNDKVEEALEIYKESRSNYHSVTANTIDDILGYSK